jgi:hypothetical protein
LGRWNDIALFLQKKSPPTKIARKVERQLLLWGNTLGKIQRITIITGDYAVLVLPLIGRCRGDANCLLEARCHEGALRMVYVGIRVEQRHLLSIGQQKLNLIVEHGSVLRLFGILPSSRMED